MAIISGLNKLLLNWYKTKFMVSAEQHSCTCVTSVPSILIALWCSHSDINYLVTISYSAVPIHASNRPLFTWTKSGVVGSSHTSIVWEGNNGGFLPKNGKELFGVSPRPPTPGLGLGLASDLQLTALHECLAWVSEGRTVLVPKDPQDMSHPTTDQ